MLIIIKINNSNIVKLFGNWKQSKGRQRTIFDCLDVNQLDSSASKRQRQQHTDETDAQKQLVSNDIRTTNDGFKSCMYSVTGVLGEVPDDITVSPELSTSWLHIHFIKRHTHHE